MRLEPVVEQLRFLGTEALLFEPTDVDEMAAVLAEALLHPEAAQAMAARSKQEMKRYTWDDVGRQYVRVFRLAIDESRDAGASLKGRVATRLRDRAVLDPRVLREVCEARPGGAKERRRLHRHLRARALVKNLPGVGRLLRAAYLRLRRDA
jgi:hypothetical protein